MFRAVARTAFRLSGRGTYVEIDIQQGRVAAGDQVWVPTIKGEKVRVTVAGVEYVDRLLDGTMPSTSVVLHLPAVAENDVGVGGMILGARPPNPAPARLTIDGRDVAVDGALALRAAIGQVGRRAAEVWLCAENGAELCILTNKTRAFVIYMRGQGDSGFTARDPRGGPGMLEFYLANGQVDEYPATWTIDFGQAIDAAVWFYSHSERDPRLSWREE